jgi:hypothetical protein
MARLLAGLPSWPRPGSASSEATTRLYAAELLFGPRIGRTCLSGRFLQAIAAYPDNVGRRYSRRSGHFARPGRPARAGIGCGPTEPIPVSLSGQGAVQWLRIAGYASGIRSAGLRTPDGPRFRTCV